MHSLGQAYRYLITYFSPTKLDAGGWSFFIIHYAVSFIKSLKKFVKIGKTEGISIMKVEVVVMKPMWARIRNN